MTSRDLGWWGDDVPDRGERLLQWVRSIRENQEYRKLADLVHASLYGDTALTGFGLSASRQVSAVSPKVSLNVVRNMVSAVTSKIAAKDKPKPTFVTDSTDYELVDKAEKLDKFVGGVFYESGVYEELSLCFRDATVFGTGVLKICEEDGEVTVDRVSPTEIVVDDLEGFYGKPRNIAQRRYVDRYVLMRLYPDHADAIRNVAEDAEDKELSYHATADMVLVTEGWHLGETKKTPGRWVVAVEGVTLVDEEWEGPFPFAFLRWTKPLFGFFGIGLAFELRGIQTEINKLLADIQKGHHLIKGHWMVQQGSVLRTQLNNDLAAIVSYTGNPPQFQAPSAIAPDTYQHLWNLYAKAFEIAGISQLNATGQKPAGLDSGAAQRAYQDIQAERFLEVGQTYEEFVVEAARQVVRCAKRMGGSYRVRSIDGEGMRVIDWSDVDLSEDLYVIKVFPTNMLPSTPAGKIQLAEDLLKLGMPTEDMVYILDFGNTTSWLKRRNAPRRVIERNIAHMLRTGDGISPEPADNHQLALRLVNEAYHEARLNPKIDEDRLELLRRYETATQDYLKPPAPPPGAMPMGAGPPGVPMPPPGPMPGPMPAGPAPPPPMPVAA